MSLYTRLKPATGRPARAGINSALFVLLGLALFAPAPDAVAAQKHRVLVSTDIGGTDPDDFQSMVHLLLYADVLDIEGLVSSPFGPGRRKDILDVIDVYEKDYASLLTHSPGYPSPDALRRITRQGATEVAPYAGVSAATDGSDWIIEVARREDERPLHVLVWGGIEDLAQALHDAPDILPRLRVYFIGGPNKKWSPNAYQYIADHHPRLWIIESNSTYRGWFVGGDQSGDLGNESFVRQHIAGQGALGSYFAELLGGTIKMGDTPAVAWLLHGNPEDPSRPGWGGQYVRAWPRQHRVFDRLTTAADEIEAFSILELALPVAATPESAASTLMVVENQSLPGYAAADGGLRIRFAPKGPNTFHYVLQSPIDALDGQAAQVTAVLPGASAADDPDTARPNWWTDDPDPANAEGEHQGARTVSRWRRDFLEDFALRMARTTPDVTTAVVWGNEVLQQPDSWYASAAARTMAASVMTWQSAEGGWPKNTNLAEPATPAKLAEDMQQSRANTIDNDATVRPMRFLARVATATGDSESRESFERGLDYLLAAQYSNGGWPQFYPLREGYFSNITFNDDAMINVMSLLRDVASAGPGFSFVDASYRERSADAVTRGLDIILSTQLRQDGVLTAWCAQYDPVTLEPAWARAYEPPSLSGNETVNIVRYLMQLEAPSAEQVAAIEAAIDWLESSAIHGRRYERFRDANGNEDARVVDAPGAGPIWARFYDIETNQPIFMGRDSVARTALDQIEQERRGGYGYYGTWPAALLAEDYPRWRSRLAAGDGGAKPRVFVLTDIENEPDDAQSLVRFLTYSNQFDVEALVATTSEHQPDETAAWRIREIVDAYEEVRDTLEQHEPGFPTADELRRVVREGLPAFGMKAVGREMDSGGSEHLIEVVDRDDPRPVWVLSWGGPNVLAQALWKVRETRSSDELAAFVAKLRVYTISDQDDSGPWLRRTFPGLFYIASPGAHAADGYHFATWSGISGDNFHGRFVGADFEIVDNPWLDEHVRSHGPLGAQYPHTEYLMEGDTPSFLHLVNNGLGNPERPDWGGWGGRYEYYTPRTKKRFIAPETREFWSDAEDEVLGVDNKWHTGNHETIWRWRSAYQNDFAARMDWTIKSYDAANHPPVARLGHPDRLSAMPGERIELSAAGSSDPDGDELRYAWFLYKEAGTFTLSSARTGAPLEINDHDRAQAWFEVPTRRVFRNGTMHIVLAVTDTGSPPLTRYRRVVIDVPDR